jgi:hypothetical protein
MPIIEVDPDYDAPIQTDLYGWAVKAEITSPLKKCVGKAAA